MSPNFPNSFPNNYDQVTTSGAIAQIINTFLLQTWQLQSINGQAFTLEFYSFDMTGLYYYSYSNSSFLGGSCEDYVQIDDGTSNNRYCYPCSNIYSCDDDGNYIGSDGSYTGPPPDYGIWGVQNGLNIATTNPGTFTSTGNITVTFRSDYSLKSNGFLAVACCAVTVTSNECEYFTKQIVCT